MASNKPTPKKTTAKKTTAKKAVAKKAPAKKATVSKTPAAKKAAAKKVATKKKPAKKSAPKASQKATGNAEHVLKVADAVDQVWDAFVSDVTTSTTNVSATVNGHVIYANDVKPAAVRKRFLAWFKR